MHLAKICFYKVTINVNLWPRCQFVLALMMRVPITSLDIVSVPLMKEEVTLTMSKNVFFFCKSKQNI